MTKEQLYRAKQLEDAIRKHKNVINSLKCESDRQIRFLQAVEPQDISNIDITAESNKKNTNDLDKSIRIVLEATKQTILSLYERELNKLETEFNNL